VTPKKEPAEFAVRFLRYLQGLTPEALKAPVTRLVESKTDFVAAKVGLLAT
jgi:hypothetical protein